ncbi:hypothetical protein OO013_03440 [Mangrovivirga sp. M17]|uniref:Uncharacterized protein n=1 Tax=Mangrovivirga halotolerans TaxID=2993936 RepID=A0ABT3RM59_9BACT|nr:MULTISPECIES: hypothetical protein [Mangrovivirga]MCX2742904.1 hypothetical protein [Mangrovivirga halotolerans]
MKTLKLIAVSIFFVLGFTQCETEDPQPLRPELEEVQDLVATDGDKKGEVKDID